MNATALMTEDPPKLWHLGVLVPNRVQQFAERMERLKINAYTPFETVKVRCGYMRTRERKRALLGPYTFIDMVNPKEEYPKLFEGSDFRNLMMYGDGFRLISDTIVEGIKILEASLTGKLSTKEAEDRYGLLVGDDVRFKPERRVQLANGQWITEPAAFGGLISRIKEIRYGERIRYVVEINLFGARRDIVADAAEFEAA